jgi:glutamate/tyrosine decarboxylase-like PLP-dependent enzyme
MYLFVMNVRQELFTALELDLDLLPLLFETEDFSLTCFFAAPVTTSNTVGSSLIKLNRRFLHHKWQIRTRRMHDKMHVTLTTSIQNKYTDDYIMTKRASIVAAKEKTT